jgi:hypothetical protein
MAAHKIPLEVRFHSKYSKLSTGCWQWIANNNGRYGKLKVNKKFINAHVISYQMHKGNLDNKWVLHTCDNSMCVNPDHLYLGSCSDNQKDRYQRSKRFYRGNDGRFISGI